MKRKDQGVMVGIAHASDDTEGLAAGAAVERIKTHIRDTGWIKVEAGRFGNYTLPIVAATQGVGMGGAAASGNLWLLGAGVMGLAITLWCVKVDAQLARREGVSIGFTGLMYALLKGNAIKPEVLSEMERRGLEIRL